MNGPIPRHDVMGAGVHAGHQIAALTALIDAETRVGFLGCLTCAVLLRPLRRCGARTKDDGLCRVFVRDDLGHDRCWSHGEGKGRTSTPRRWPPTSWGAGWQAAGARVPHGRGA
jgi:hypothetical protein